MRFFLILILLCPISIKAENSFEKAIVRIYVDSQNSRKLGTGFFVKPDTIVTAYHVVQGANKIEINGCSLDSVQASISNYDEYWDLALLTLQQVNNNSFFLELSSIPSNLSLREGFCIGHPDGKINYRVPIGFPQNTPIPSYKFLGPDSIQLFEKFNETSLQPYILPLEMTLQPGMSGAPVIVNNKVIGVISGSQAQSGRTFGWAIPSYRVDNLLAESKNLKLDNGVELPELKLLNSNLVSSKDPILSSPLLKVGEFQKDRERYEIIISTINFLDEYKDYLDFFIDNSYNQIYERSDLLSERIRLAQSRESENILDYYDRVIEDLDIGLLIEIEKDLESIDKIVMQFYDLFKLLNEQFDYIDQKYEDTKQYYDQSYLRRLGIKNIGIYGDYMNFVYAKIPIESMCKSFEDFLLERENFFLKKDPSEYNEDSTIVKLVEIFIAYHEIMDDYILMPLLIQNKIDQGFFNTETIDNSLGVMIKAIELEALQK